MAANYSSRRMADYSYAGSRRGSNGSWGLNRNAVRHQSSISLGPIWMTILFGVLVAFLGILFLSSSTAVTTYDRAIAGVKEELSTLEAERDALAIENAKINAAAANMEQNQVASNMVDASSSAYVGE